MNILLDTHAFIWHVNQPELLSSTASAAIQDPNNQILLSVASAWEMSIKSNLGKLNLGSPVDVFVWDGAQRNGFGLVPIELRYIHIVETLLLHHRDPFDRLLVAQCLADNLQLISVDTILDDYGITRVW